MHPSIESSSRLSLDALAKMWLESRPVSKVTARAYRLEIERFLRWARQQRETTSTISNASFEAFGRCVISTDTRKLRVLHQSRPLSPTSQAQCRRIVGAWLRWCAAEGHVPPKLAAPSKWPVHSEAIPPLPKANTLRVGAVVAPNLSDHDWTLSEVRMHWVAGLAFWAGLGPAEIAALKRHSLRIRRRQFEISVSDGRGEPRWIPGPDVLRDIWRLYEGLRSRSEWAVTGLQLNESVSPATVARIIRAAAPSHGERVERSWNSRALKRSFVALAVRKGWTSDDLRQHLRNGDFAGVHHHLGNGKQWRSRLENLVQV